MYIYHNKKIDEYHIFSNLKKLSDNSGVGYEMLKTHFTRNKLSRLDREGYTVVKADVTRSERK